MINDQSKEFILEFFKHCKIQDEKGVLTISEVPADFEEFVGKKSPYKFVFDFNLHTRVKDSELIMQGSYFLLAIRDYLENKGQTSLLKLDLSENLDNLNESLKIKDSRIIEIKPNNFKFISEFSFLSIYQYLNEKNQFIHKILTQGNKVLDLDISKFKTTTGNKNEIPEINIDESYLIAKKTLNEQVAKEIKPIKLALKEKLDKELQRIKDHYFKQIKEKDEEVERCSEKINLLKSKLKHTFYERDIRILQMKIRESTIQLETLKKKAYKERLITEEKFHINDEVEKQVLAIKNTLINVTLFYYSTYELSLVSKSKKITKQYDPLLKIIF